MIRRNQGHIVTISSAAGLIGTPMLTDYSSTKSAAFGFDESLRMEFRKRNIDIKTTVVCPYFINTGMFAGVRTRFPWLLPILDEEKVAEKTVTAIQKNRRRVLIPKIVYIVWLLRYLPVRWFDNIAAFLGLSSTMDRFTGRSHTSFQED
jgi:all-trans-retinol dehydrogenase (NAD+)